MYTLYIVNVITLIWFPLYRYSVTVQVFFCVNITTNKLLTAGVVLCYSRVCACIKGHLNLSLDILCWVCLRCAIGTYTSPHTLSTRVYLWIFPSCFTWQPVLSVVGLWGLVITTVCASCQPLTPCEYYRALWLTRVAVLCYHGVPLVLTRGEGVDLC